VINVANVVTVARVFLALITLSLLFLPGDGESNRWAAFFLTILVIWADGLDGFFARLLKQSSKFGGMLDIAGDRAVELAYWIVYAVLGWVPVWVPLLFLVRGIFVDAIRAYLSEQGFTAFGTNTMMQTPLGKFLVASKFSRFTYAIVKAVAFCLLIAAHINLNPAWHIGDIANVTVYLACIFCVLRGLPVLLEAPALFAETPKEP
jgi:CDP-diacylglycerol---glycerol-3-phosphate 3-phosphatidyltransferase